MAGTYEWQRATYTLNKNADGEGWFLQDTMNIPTPYSLRRLICRCDVAGWVDLSTNRTPTPIPPGGWVELNYTMSGEFGAEAFYSALAPVAIGASGVTLDGEGAWRQSASLTPTHPLDFDMDIRRRATGTPGLDLTFYWHYHPQRFQDPTYLNYGEWYGTLVLAALVFIPEP